jgi:tetratricopeptide (TPR) repeat protein
MASLLDGLEARHPILTEEPEDDAQRQKITDELKARGNGAFKAKSMREALALYARAIELTPGDHALRGNSSMVQLQLGDFPAALSDAEEAIKLDPKNDNALENHRQLVGPPPGAIAVAVCADLLQARSGMPVADAKAVAAGRARDERAVMRLGASAHCRFRCGCMQPCGWVARVV